MTLGNAAFRAFSRGGKGRKMIALMFSNAWVRRFGEDTTHCNLAQRLVDLNHMMAQPLCSNCLADNHFEGCLYGCMYSDETSMPPV
jgi:hypothetical protein|mmetsp:Transcript_61113/g.98778  ORF Transcript_61113/g.98778 Transcript_61113/m.98778 type:complete len:86 (+) Transcript_61113:33-290(+)